MPPEHRPYTPLNVLRAAGFRASATSLALFLALAIVGYAVAVVCGLAFR